MIEILIVIAPLFLIILLGAVLERLKLTNEHWSPVLNNYALKIGFPALIFSALTKASFVFSEQVSLISSNSLFLVASFLIAYFFGKVFRIGQKNLRTLFICLGFGNVAYLGIPTLAQVFGDAVLPALSLIIAVYLFWLFTVGVGYLEMSQQKSKRDLFKTVLLHLVKNPLLIAVALGLLVTILNLPIPSVIAKSISMVAASVTPVVLLVIGFFIGRSKIGSFKKWQPAIAFSFVTLLLLPALFYFGVRLFGFLPSQFSISIIDAAMPLAITPFALAEAYKLNKGFIARSIVLSTILAAITIPFWVSILN